ncbi:MAG: GTPase Era, partial [Oscillospiraceae bacterium]|nr:GTPase Era [Oscillospiraceae bacterium]
DILVLNKVDTFPKEKILPFIEENKDKYQDIFCVSAKTGEGVPELISYLKAKMPDGERFFPDDEITTQPERVLMAEYIREQAFRLLGDEIPFGTAVIIDKMKVNDKNILEVDAVIYCEKERHKGMIIGKNGSKLKEISTKARLQGERFFGKKIFLQVRVKPAENWRDNDVMIKNFLGQ